ncbi:MAG TPA: PKD domain-containing protein [Solirubrobacterales bacterium]
MALASALGLLAAGPPAEAQARTAYVVDRALDVVVPVDLDTMQPGQAIPVGDPQTVDHPAGIAVAPDGKRAYVTLSNAAAVAVIDTQGNAVVDTITIPDTSPYGIAFAPDGKSVYVSDPMHGAVHVIDPEDNVVVASYATGGTFPFAIAVSPDGGTLYVANAGTGTVAAIDAKTGERALIDVGAEPLRITLTPDGNFAYVPLIRTGEIQVIDTRAKDVVKTISLGGRPLVARVTPDGKTVYVALWDTPSKVYAIDVETNAVAGEVPVDDSPIELVINPDGRSAYVYSSPAHTITPIDTATGKAGSPLALPNHGLASENQIAIVPNQPPVAELSAPATAYAGVPVTLDASGSHDDESIATYALDFGDGASAATDTPSRAHVYAEPGTYQATVTVDDGDGCTPLPQFFDLGLASPFTGQTAYCNGPSRITSEPVEIRVEELPRLGLSVSLERRQSSLRAVRVGTTCRNLDCTARAFGRIEVRRPGSKPKRFGLEAERRALSADTATPLAPGIPAMARRAARRALREGGRVRARVRVSAKSLGGQQRVKLGRVRIVG